MYPFHATCLAPDHSPIGLIDRTCGLQFPILRPPSASLTPSATQAPLYLLSVMRYLLSVAQLRRSGEHAPDVFPPRALFRWAADDAHRLKLWRRDQSWLYAPCHRIVF